MTPEQDIQPTRTFFDDGFDHETGCLTADPAEPKHNADARSDGHERFLEIIHAANRPILLIDGGKFVDCNDAAAQMLGHFGNEFLLTHPGELSPETQPDGCSSLEKARQMMQIALDTGFHRFEWMHRKASGEDIPVEVSLTPVVHDGRTILHCVWRDITEEKRAKRELELTLNRLERLNQLQGRLILPGKRGEKLSLITSAAVDILGLDFCRIWITRPADLCEAGCPHAEGGREAAACHHNDGCLHLVASSGRYTHLDGRHRRIPIGRCMIGELAAGRERKAILRELQEHPRGFNRDWIAEIGLRSFAGYRLCDTADRILGVLGMFSTRPFSDEDDAFASNLAETTSKTVLEIEAHEELVEARSKAEAATKAKDCFLANMSHEIRTPMTAILGFADILVRDLTDPDALQAAETVKRNGEHLLTIINDVLDIARIEAGRIEVELMSWSPSRVFEDCVALLRLRAEAKGLTLTYERDGPLPETVSTDPTRLRQILINLIGNAIKFTEEGSIRVVARFVEEPGSSREIQCDVIDTGIGIPDSFKDAVFDPFMQVDQSSTRNFEGTGLGLAISRRLAGMLGGDLRLRNSPGGGSIFTLTLPVGVQETNRPTESAPMLIENPRASDESGALRRIHGRVLLVEDVPVSQLLLKAMLREVGVEVTVAQDGGEAVEKALATLPGAGHGGGARPEPFDVILMDMQMPVLDGYEATRRLRSEGYSGPIIAVTAHAMRGDRQKCLEAGCDDYLTKPIDREKLLETLNTWL